MKFPSEHRTVQVGMVLEFCDGLRARIVELVRHDGEPSVRLSLEDVKSPEEFQSIDTVQKWVGRGLWKLRRK